ncbi:YqaA family protein [Urechidicola croceus]|uniref:Short-chain dehydrogenase n=1 Tax=Urechidicola croceus TaxID=1850246 RepID=A0A1D8PAH0_9FLAO|nr:short-chain dehydrogenase [Urechidicola croceus]AOW21580.1 short-chain dehydrogenase [Urechidicola croceus]
MNSNSKTQKKTRIQLLHQYYSYTGFYSFIKKSLKKAIIPSILIIVGLWAFNTYVFNLNDGLKHITNTFSTPSILTIFFLSESFLGLIPPEIFIAWSKKMNEPVLMLTILATLSYIGGIVSFFIGKTSLKIKKIRTYLDGKMSKYLKNTKKWGGFLIIAGALLPLPFSITCISAGIIKYPLRGVLLFGLFRFVRFGLYGLAIYKIVE